MELRQKNITRFAFLLVVILIGLFSVMSLLDAPEYVHCTHIGVCEFLEIMGDLKSSRDINTMLSIMSKLELDAFNDFSIREQNKLLPKLYQERRYINRHQNILKPSLGKGDIIKPDHEPIFPLIRICLPSQTLQIITTSIIKS